MKYLFFILLTTILSTPSAWAQPNNMTSLNCDDPEAFSLGNGGFVGANPSTATGSCGQCCFQGSDLDGDGDQEVSFSVENSVWFDYCNNSGSPMTIDFVVDEVNNNCNVQGAIFVGPSANSATIDCNDPDFQEYGSNPGGNADGFTFTVTIPDGECAYIMVDGYAGATCGALTIEAQCPCFPPVITATSSTDPICPTGSTTLTASGATTYSWSPNTGLSSTTGSSITASPASTTTYTVTGTFNGCVGTTTITVTVATPEIPDAGADQTGCPSDVFIIGADPIYNVGGIDYSWSGGAGSGTLDLQGGGQDHGTASVSPAVTTTYTVSIIDGNGCVGTDDVTITIACPLPIELANFEVKCVNNKNILTWTTLSELNNDYFSIEKSCDGSVLEFLSRIDGAQMSNTSIEYVFTDNSENLCEEDVQYYYLNQTDINGETKLVGVTSSNCLINVSEPVIDLRNNNLSVQYDQPFVFCVFSADGRRIVRKNSSNHSAHFNSSKLSSGIYIVYIESDVSYTERVLIRN